MRSSLHILLANLFLLGSFFGQDMVTRIMLIGLGFFWLIIATFSMRYELQIERLETKLQRMQTDWRDKILVAILGELEKLNKNKKEKEK